MDAPILELFAKLKLDSSEYEEGLNNSKSMAGSFASFLGKAASIGIAAFSALGTGISVIAKEAVDSFAQYEQLLGGVQKLYGNAGLSVEEYAEKMHKSVDEVSGEWQKLEDAQNAVLQNAEKAYMTSGMSMNEYMETATTLSASLIKSLNGDTVKAAEITDIAMRAMSDNINTFGTDAEAVQNAFKGLSRQNYMMIDNLKLGYAGTAQGMLELINDSGVLGKELKNTSELASVGFDQMVLAIQKVQEQQGIAGTTAREAMYTIEGSANATKKAWENVITSIGRGEGVSEAFDGLMTALFGGEDGGGLVSNIVPRVQMVLTQIGDALVEFTPIIADKLPEILSSILPALYDTVTNLIGTIVNYILENLPLLIQSGTQMLEGLVEGIKTNFPKVVEVALDILTRFINSVVSSLPQILASGIKIVIALVQGIIDSIPKVQESAKEIVENAKKAFIEFDWIGLGKNVVDGIAEGISRFGEIIWNTLKGIVSGAWGKVKSFLGISSPSKLMRDTVGRFIPEGLAEGIDLKASTVYDAMEDMAKGTVDAFNPVFDDINGNVKFSVPSRNSQVNGGYVQNVYINSPTALTPSEVARQTKNATRDMILSLKGV